MSADIEKWASGLKRIYDECTAADVTVEFKRVKTGFVVSFHRPKWEEGEGLEKGGQKTVEKTREKVREKTREKILRLIKENPLITTSEIAEKAGLSPKGVEWNIGKLKKEGRIKRIGPDRGGHWEIFG